MPPSASMSTLTSTGSARPPRRTAGKSPRVRAARRVPGAGWVPAPRKVERALASRPPDRLARSCLQPSIDSAASSLHRLRIVTDDELRIGAQHERVELERQLYGVLRAGDRPFG